MEHSKYGDDFNVGDIFTTAAITVTETHVVRYFFPLEIVHHLDDAGFRTLSLSSFPDLEAKADETAWNALVVARVKPQ